MNYFFDNCISYRFAHMLRALEVPAIALRDEFPEDIDDRDLFRALRKRDIVFITHDSRQKTRPHEARALKELGATNLWLEPFWAKMTFWKQAEWLIRRWPLIDGFAKGAVKGTCALIKQNGKCEMFQL